MSRNDHDPFPEEAPADPHPHARPDRHPGEAAFSVLMVLASLVLLWEAYGISGFEALSAPGTVPMATTAVMAVCAAIVMLRTFRLPRAEGEGFWKVVLPRPVIVVALLLVGYALLLRPLGFLPTSLLFLVIAVKYLSRRGWGFTLAVSAGSLLAIYLVFRIVFTVLMPPGIVPEGEMIQFFRDLIPGRAG
ncbi:MAG: tripartite tricarboxylate transporter TctB family protein [Rhodobacteraceae bacterium]|nr:tripartite tricarboxylate transporter TctB family protein [Paracoccaceae bacterium]